MNALAEVDHLHPDHWCTECNRESAELHPDTRPRAKRRWRRVEAADLDYFIILYEEDRKPVREIARLTNFSYCAVYRWLLDAGVTMRPHGGARMAVGQ